MPITDDRVSNARSNITYGSKYHTRINEALAIYNRLVLTKTPQSKYSVVLAMEMKISGATAESYLWVCKKRTQPPPPGAIVADVDTIAKIQPVKASNTGNKSKMQIATEIYLKSDDKSRKTMLDRFVNEVGMTFAGAQTYYYTIKKANP